jgi:hypothetical protein
MNPQIKPYLNAFDGERSSTARKSGTRTTKINGPNLKGGKQNIEIKAESITK